MFTQKTFTVTLANPLKNSSIPASELTQEDGAKNKSRGEGLRKDPLLFNDTQSQKAYYIQRNETKRNRAKRNETKTILQLDLSRSIELANSLFLIVRMDVNN